MWHCCNAVVRKSGCVRARFGRRPRWKTVAKPGADFTALLSQNSVALIFIFFSECAVLASVVRPHLHISAPRAVPAHCNVPPHCAFEKKGMRNNNDNTHLVSFEFYLKFHLRN